MGGRIGIAQRTARERWGILGGIFDPIHYGHLAIAEQARDSLGLARILFVPAGRPVHKDVPAADAEHRARMVSLAIADNACFELSRVEIDSDRPSYTVETLAALTSAQPDVDFALIVSSETAAALPTWYEPQRVLDLAQVAIVSRLGHSDISDEWIGRNFYGREDRFVRVDSTHLGHSSTTIRARAAAGKSIRYLVPPPVQTYIEDNRLYGSDDRPAA